MKRMIQESVLYFVVFQHVTFMVRKKCAQISKTGTHFFANIIGRPGFRGKDKHVF